MIGTMPEAAPPVIYGRRSGGFAIAGLLFVALRFLGWPDPYEENTPAVIGVADYDSTLRAGRAALARNHA